MPISSDLFMAILAMDSYNRAYNRALVVDGNQVGNARLSINADDPAGEAQSVSFFAQAYTIDDNSIAGLIHGQRIISYRGTDSVLDVGYGWPVGGGSFDAAQAALA